MSSVVFLRGVNVGGHKAFRPKEVARQLSDLDVINIGAAGTFVVRKKIGQTALRAEFLKLLPFAAELMICGEPDLVALSREGPLSDEQASKDTRCFVSVMAKKPAHLPPLPLSQPAGDKWQVKIMKVSGRFALSVWRRTEGTFIYPNEVVEKQFRVPATTRSWNTIETICSVLRV
jgi:uncharacterized protein (DUF1697 family)